MLPTQRLLIAKNWIDLSEVAEIKELAEFLTKNNVFAKEEINEMFSSGIDRDSKTTFLQELENKEDGFDYLVQWLDKTGNHNLASRLTENRSRCVPFRQSNEEEESEDERTSSIETEISSFTFDEKELPLKIEVKRAKQFSDDVKYSPNLSFYTTRSKRRGRVLIINNYEFREDKHKYRTGAKVDEENLIQLFKQMGGYIIEAHSNKTIAEMKKIIKDFAEYKKEKECDLCFVFIMSHGTEHINTTVIFGTDGDYISTLDIQAYFSNQKCTLFRGKPKVFIYQVCRGRDLDLSQKHHIEYDGKVHSPLEPPVSPICKTAPPLPKPHLGVFRAVEDVLVGYATMLGSKAHRDPYRGTWYIELICQKFMDSAKEESVDHLLMMVDEGLRTRMSEVCSVQTSDIENKGFKKLYLNPGIYEENGGMKIFR